MSEPKIAINIKGQISEYTLDEITETIKTLENAELELSKRISNSKYQKLADSGIDKVRQFITERTRIAENMDYMTNGGFDYEVEELIPFLKSDDIRQLGFYGEYLDVANKVLESRGEDPISKGPRKM